MLALVLIPDALNGLYTTELAAAIHAWRETNVTHAWRETNLLENRTRLTDFTYAASDVFRLFYGPPILLAEGLAVSVDLPDEILLIGLRRLDTNKLQTRILFTRDPELLSCIQAFLRIKASKGDPESFLLDDLIRNSVTLFSAENHASEIVKIFSLEIPHEFVDNKKIIQRYLKRTLYLALSEISGESFPWGSLTGIRPSYIAGEYLDRGYDPETAARFLSRDYFVQANKAGMAIEAALAAKRLSLSNPEACASLYISVPFCPSRCSYCSFSTKEGIGASEAVLEAYCQALCIELEGFLSETDMHFETLYVGGGTPTTLSSEQLERIFATVDRYLPLSRLREITLEAGRVDTIDQSKLMMGKRMQVSRLCINPQTMNQESLRRINRKHSPELVQDVFHMAREAGYNHINMDLIAGLPGETEAVFMDSLAKLIALRAESITIHALAMKRRSDLQQEQYRLHDRDAYFSKIYGLKSLTTGITDSFLQQDAKILTERLGHRNLLAESMLEQAQRSLQAAAYDIYYMYRQKDGIGGLENTGYARNGFACIYNLRMMNDEQSIVAFGAGAMSKKLSKGRMERLANLRLVQDYIQNISELINRKRMFFGAY